MDLVSTGLSASAYSNDSDIVITYKGTNFLFGPNNTQTINDLLADLAMGGGSGSSQIFLGALFYQQVKEENDAGAGDDVIDGGTGNDTLRGGAGNDAIEGNDGDDHICGDNTRFDILIGNVSAADHGNDVLSGGAGNDTLLGQGGSDALYGGEGDDTLWGDNSDLKDTPPEYAGQDYLDGGNGNDQLIGDAEILCKPSTNDALWAMAA